MFKARRLSIGLKGITAEGVQFILWTLIPFPVENKLWETGRVRRLLDEHMERSVPQAGRVVYFRGCRPSI